MNDKLLKLLKRLEWSASTPGQGSGFMSSGNDGPLVSTCPICRGINPKDRNAGHFMHSAQGHRDDCEIQAAIKRRLLMSKKEVTDE